MIIAKWDSNKTAYGYIGSSESSSGVDQTARNDISDHIADSDVHVTADEKAAWNAKANLSDIPTTLEDDVARQAITTHEGNAEIHVTADEKAAWNAINYSNPNLLDNSNFLVNQRGGTEWTTGTSSAYFVDRWTSSRANLSLTDDGLLFSWNGSDGSNGLISQTVDVSSFLGEKVAISLKVNGKIYTVTAVTTTTMTIKTIADVNLKIALSYTSNNCNALVIQTSSTEPVTIKWVKMELGNHNTAFASPDPATELAKCQRYYQIRSTGDVAAVDLRPTMRVTPTVTRLSDGNYSYSADF